MELDDVLIVPFSGLLDTPDGKVFVQRSGHMKYLGRTDGNRMSTDWLLTVPDFLDSDGIKFSGTGPTEFIKIFEDHRLYGPELHGWSNHVSISRAGVDRGTVNNVKKEALEAKDAKMNSKKTTPA